MKPLAIVAALVLAGAAAVPAWAAATPRHTPRVAQTNVLRAPRVLGRFSPALVDPRTKLLKNNSKAVCAGIGRPRSGAFATLRCVVSNGHVRVSVRYLAQRHNGFELHLIRVWRAA
jgi:hypothetical protein